MAKNFWVSGRPVILAMEDLTHFMNKVQSSGKDLGFLYPDQGPLVQLMGPRKVQDRLTYKQLPVLSLSFP